MLNKHNNNLWYELLALSTLQVVFPLEFCNLKLSDRPDLIDYDTQRGIEVIHPVDEKHEMLNSYYYNHLCGKTIDQIPPEGLKKFRSNSYDIIFDPQDNTVSSYRMPYRQFDLEIIFRAIDKKMKKLNNNLYTYSNNISLFLEMSRYSNELADYSTAKEILNYIKKIKQDYCKSFDEIFLDCIMKLYRINVAREEITEIDTSNLMDSIKHQYDANEIKEAGDNFQP